MGIDNSNIFNERKVAMRIFLFITAFMFITPAYAVTTMSEAKDPRLLNIQECRSQGMRDIQFVR